MSSYSELIKNFERIRAYMREFYVYGFKSRDDYSKKSARSYDDERRRIESWLGDHMSFVRTPEGKNVFISIDSRNIRHNPFYNAWKAKSFTDGDVTLHFILFDILHEPSIKKTIAEILEEIDTKYLAGFESPMMFDESTVRKKLKEYCEAGIIATEKIGRKAYYHRTESIDIDVLKVQFEADNNALANGGEVSLLAKWLPSVNASSTETVLYAKKIAKHFGLNDANYRKALVALRAHIRIIENNLREKDYSFDYAKQPSI